MGCLKPGSDIVVWFGGYGWLYRRKGGGEENACLTGVMQVNRETECTEGIQACENLHAEN